MGAAARGKQNRPNESTVRGQDQRTDWRANGGQSNGKKASRAKTGSVTSPEGETVETVLLLLSCCAG